MSKGRYGEYGGQYISETLMNELIYLEEQYNHYMNDPDFVEELNTLLKEYAGSGIQVINGRYGPYLKKDGSNYRIPKGVDASSLTEDKCKEIIEASEPTKSSFRRSKSRSAK